MILDHFWKFLFIALVAVGCWFWLQANSKKKAHHRHVAGIAELIDTREENAPRDAEDAADRTYKIIALLRVISDIKGSKFDVRETVMAAAEMNEAGSGLADVLADNIASNYSFAESYGLFAEDTIDEAMFRLEDGSAPKASRGPWAGEKVEVGYRIPPTIASEIAAHLANRVLLPHSVRRASDASTLTKDMDLWAERLKSAKVLDLGTRQAIREQYYALRELSNKT